MVPGCLLAGEYPGAKKDAEARRKLSLFLSAGFTFYLDLTEESELEPYAHLLQEEAAARGKGVENRRMPIPDLGNSSPAKMTRILDTLDAAIETGHRVCAHCWGGIGHTGTIVGSYLLRRGLTGGQVPAEIACLRQDTPDAWRGLTGDA